MKSMLGKFKSVLLSIVLILAVALPATLSAQALGNYAENQTVDVIFRGQTPTFGANLYVGLSTSACSDSSTGSEVSGGSYARVPVERSLASWSGTQTMGSTAASTGTGGSTSNNVTVTFTTPTAGWGLVTHFFIAAEDTGSNIIACNALTVPKTINSGDAVRFNPGTIITGIQ